jgi:hypothetical protein
MSMFSVVKAKEKDGAFWKEVADVLTVSATGAEFILARECKVGQLISLLLPLPPHLRCHDHDKELYRVWGLIQHCTPLKKQNSFHMGVAFIGKDAPRSYERDPSQTYRICGMKENRLWKVDEAETPFKIRKDVRHRKRIGFYLALLDSNKVDIGGEQATTENISRSGAAVYSTLDISVGDRVKFISEEYDFSGLAVVCNKDVLKDKRTRLHLSFVENQFPIESLERKPDIIQQA